MSPVDDSSRLLPAAAARTITMADSCTYVPLEEYNWELITLFINERGLCHEVSLAWNWTVICLLVAMHAVSIWISLELIMQTAVTFKTWKTWYFW